MFLPVQLEVQQTLLSDLERSRKQLYGDFLLPLAGVSHFCLSVLRPVLTLPWSVCLYQAGSLANWDL